MDRVYGTWSHQLVYGDGTKSHHWRWLMSRAVIYEKFGGPEVLELREVPEPHAGPGEVRIRVAAAGLNPMDGGLAANPELAARFGVTVPAGFGYDVAGVVDEVGPGATGFTVGQRVFGGVMARAAADFAVVATPPRPSGRLPTASPTRWRPHSRWRA
jgi:NADPH:quinone reductase-like Zn-dependent oxidoreductase